MRRAARVRCGARGFTLLEVLVAFTVLALIAVPAAQVIGANLRGIEHGSRYARAVSIARSVLDEARVRRAAETLDVPLSGSTGDGPAPYEWTVAFEPYFDELLGDDGRGRPGLERITVTVSWDERSVALESLVLDVERQR